MAEAVQSTGRAPPSLSVDVVEHGARKRRGWVRCELGKDLAFSTAGLESYFFSQWEPVVYDAMLVGAAMEFCDRTRRRPADGWGRDLELRIPVHEPNRWSAPAVFQALHDALSFLTGDRWSICFQERGTELTQPRQGMMDLGSPAAAVIPFSDGLDSRAVAGLLERELGDGLVRVRLGSRGQDGKRLSRERKPFTSVPFDVRSPQHNCEPSARSRGFKFGLISGLAAYLAGASRVILPESGQGALGPVLVPVGQAYADYRTHPLFTAKMEALLKALLGHEVRYDFPRLWHTKAETLAAYVELCGDDAIWADTRSCWQQNRHIGVAGKARQCGVCAACMLRRMSVHAAGQEEPDDTYVWEDLSAPEFESGVADDFDRSKVTQAMYEYAIAGTLHLDHLAALQHSRANEPALDLSAFQLASPTGISKEEIGELLRRLLSQHEKEWNDFMASLGRNSFISKWAVQTHEHA